MGLAVFSPHQTSRASRDDGSQLSNRALILILLTSIVAWAGCATNWTAAPESIDGVSFEYKVTHRIRDKQKRDILYLAAEQGMTNLDRVEIINALPTDLLLAVVLAKPVVSVRDEWVRSLTFGFNWGRGAVAPPEGVPRRGTVWLMFDDTQHRKILIVGDKSYRVRLDEGLPIGIAEDILRRFLSGEMQPAGSVAHYLRWIRDSTPTHIQRREDGRYMISFWKESGGSGNLFVITRDPDTGALEVTGTGSISI